MSVTSTPTSGGTSTASRLLTCASVGTLPLRVMVKTPKAIVRPTVGLRVGSAESMRDVLARALAFNDRYVKSEVEIIEVLAQRMDIVISNERTEGTERAVRVQPQTTIGEALLFEPMDRVLFELLPLVSARSASQ